MGTMKLDDRAQLRDYIVDHFVKSELDVVIFELGIKKDDPSLKLNRKITSKIAQELIFYFERRNNIGCLIERIRKHRPSKDLEELQTTYGECDQNTLTGNIDLADSYTLEANDDSFFEAGINRGDKVIISKKAYISNGDLAVFILANTDKPLIKRIYFVGNRYELKPENTTFGTIYADASNVQIQGKVINVIRKSNLTPI